MGYQGFSKSNNAVAAEASGLKTVTQLSRVLRCSSVAVKKFLIPTEWHHTGKFYNETNYYSEDLLIAVATGKDKEDYDEEELVEGKILLEKLRSYKIEKKDLKFEGCEIEWIGWGGTRRHPIAHPYKAMGIIEYTGGSFVTVLIENKPPFRKKMGTNGFRVVYRGEILVNEMETGNLQKGGGL